MLPIAPPHRYRKTDNTDSNGNAIFYDLIPDTTGYDYVINGQLANYSALPPFRRLAR